MFQITAENGSGYTLIEKGPNLYQLQTPRGIYTGSLEDVSRYAVKTLGFNVDEFLIGVTEMESHFHDAATYGVLKRFMYTFDTEEVNAKASGH